MNIKSQNNWMIIDCPMRGEKHKVEVKVVKSKATIKGKEVDYNEKFCVCKNVPKEESEFCTGKFVDENLISAQNAYREKYSLMTTYEIVELRNDYSLSQVELSKLLGWGEATVSRYKTMWYIDVRSFLELGISMTGLVYQHEKLGALPLEHEKLMFLKDVSVDIEDGVDDRVAYKFQPNKNVKTNVFTRDQKNIIDEVIAKFKTWNTKKNVNYMHKEPAYKKTKQGEIIPF